VSGSKCNKCDICALPCSKWLLAWCGIEETANLASGLGETADLASGLERKQAWSNCASCKWIVLDATSLGSRAEQRMDAYPEGQRPIVKRLRCWRREWRNMN
jgi:hypothetical protein